MALAQLKALIDAESAAIESWFDEQYGNEARPFYSSVDLRYSGHKLAPVDTNLFPAGFNNLSDAAKTNAAASMHTYLSTHYPEAKRILIVPENHTRNLGYLANLHTLCRLLTNNGYETALGRMDSESDEAIMLETAAGEQMESLPILRDGDIIRRRDGFTPDLVLVNNDLTSGAPEMLCGAAQPVIPRPGMGWYRRRKSEHFNAYTKTANAFSQRFDLDPWLISTVTHQCGLINFREKKGIECVALGVEKVLRAVREKYQQYGIDETPYVFIKADSGTYGMGIMVAESGEDVYAMNKRTRNKMNVIKEGAPNTHVVLQEGVPTVDSCEGAVAEPLIYLANGEVAGGVYRSNPARDARISLNTPDMVFRPMDESGDDYAAYRLVARLATLATLREEYGNDACEEALEAEAT